MRKKPYHPLTLAISAFSLSVALLVAAIHCAKSRDERGAASHRAPAQGSVR